MAAHTLVVELDANQRIMNMLNAACISVFTEHECVSMSLDMAARASGTPSCQLPLFCTTHTHTHTHTERERERNIYRLQLQPTVTVVR